MHHGDSCLTGFDSTKLIVFTDLDGTLLDHDTYSFTPARPAIDKLKRLGIPLILISSKTRVEIRQLQKQLSIQAPYICENGAAVYWQGSVEAESLAEAESSEVFSPSRTSIVAYLHGLRKTHSYKFVGFSDCSVERLVELTGLSNDQAELAAQREFTEPLQWQGSEQELTCFRQQLASEGLRLVRGGRFYSVMGQFDKQTAMAWLKQRFLDQVPNSGVKIVALGDSGNDEDMLNAADIAVVVRSEQSEQLHIAKPSWVIRTEKAGPCGWAEAMNEILEREI